jgi:ribosome-associated protein
MTTEPRRKAPRTTDVAGRLPETVRRAVEAALDKKALDMVVLDLKGPDAFTDYFIVCSGRTVRQVRAIVDEVQKQLREAGDRPSHVEGYQNAEWVLLDCFDFIVHVFTEDTRRFYDLERLWGNAERVEFPA